MKKKLHPTWLIFPQVSVVFSASLFNLQSALLLKILLPHFNIFVSEEERTTKVKVQGRRRLCKIVHEDAGKSVAVDESKFDELIDLDSPIPVPRSVVQIEESEGKNEIRDILSELNAKFELLSVERKPRPNRVEGLVAGKESHDDEGLEYGSAGSSFSPQQ